MSWRPPVVKQAILALLASQAAGRFSVEGFQRQSHAAEELILRHVTVFYRSGTFDKGRSGWLQGPFRHTMTFSIELQLAAPAKADLAALEDEHATAQALMSALAAVTSAAANADALWDELAGIIWGILIDPRNGDTLGGVTIDDRWLPTIRKEAPSRTGELVLLTGAMDYTCTVVETADGEAGVPAGPNAIDTTLQETADPSGAPLDPAAQGARST